MDYLHNTASFPASCHQKVLNEDLKWCSLVLDIKKVSKTTLTVSLTTGFQTTTVTQPLESSQTTASTRYVPAFSLSSSHHLSREAWLTPSSQQLCNHSGHHNEH